MNELELPPEKTENSRRCDGLDYKPGRNGSALFWNGSGWYRSNKRWSQVVNKSMQYNYANREKAQCSA